MPSWVIIGASRGLGYQYLKSLSADPSNTVIGVVRDPSKTQAQVEKDGLKNVHIIHGDLDSIESLNAAAKAASEITGGLVDHLIINGVRQGFEDAFTKPSEFTGREKQFRDDLIAHIDTNTVGLMYAANSFLPYIKKSSIKKVIYISSGHTLPGIVEVSGFDNFLSYTLSKTASNMLIKKYAQEFREQGVIFVALSPGYVSTQKDEEGNVPPPVTEAFSILTAMFQKFDPTCKGPTEPDDSVGKQINVINGVTIKDSGKFISHHGNETEWFN